MKVKSLFLILSLLLACVTVSAKTYRVEDVPMVHLQDNRRYVSNPDNILSSEAVSQMDEMLKQLETTTGIQVLVVAVEGIDGGDCFDFAYRLGEQNGVGEKGRDNGLVVLLSTEERCVQFATGYGLEGVLPDATCKRIQERYMLDYFRAGDWSGGMLAGVEVVCGTLDGSMEADEFDDDDWLVGIIIFLAVFVIPVLVLLLQQYHAKRCPACKKHKLQCVKVEELARVAGKKVVKKTFRCGHCGHLVVRQQQIDDDEYHHRGGPFIGGGLSGGLGGGGGISGGSFGGGSFGGGGSGSRF